MSEHHVRTQQAFLLLTLSWQCASVGPSSSWRISSSRFRVPLLDKLTNNLIYWGHFSTLACESGQFIEVREILTGVRKSNSLSNKHSASDPCLEWLLPSGQSLMTFSLSWICLFLPDRQNRGWRRGQLAPDQQGTGSNSHPRLLMETKQDKCPGSAFPLTSHSCLMGHRADHELCRNCNCCVVFRKWNCSTENWRVTGS